MFPLYNDVFRSPAADPLGFIDPRFRITDPLALVDLPLSWMRMDGTYFSELLIHDYVLAAALAAALAGLAALAVRGTRYAGEEAGRLFLLLFFPLAYAGWLFGFGVPRYLVPALMLAGAVIAAAGRLLPRGRAAALAGLALLAVQGDTDDVLWARRPFAPAWVMADPSAVLPASGTVIVTAPAAGSARRLFPGVERFVVPSLGVFAPVRAALEEAARAGGPLWVLQSEPFGGEEAALLLEAGFVADQGGCTVTGIGHGGLGFSLCPARLAAPGAEPGRPAPYRWGDTVPLGRGRGGEPYMTGSWHRLTAEGAWTEGPAAAVLLPLEGPPPGDLRLEVELPPGWREHATAPRLEVAVNGTVLARVPLAGADTPDRLAFPVPVALLEGRDRVRVAFAAAPPVLGGRLIGEGMLPVGAGVAAIRLVPAGGPAMAGQAGRPAG